MRLINKKKRAPSLWRNYAAINGATFDDAPSDAKTALRLALYQEQGGLCAYCMCQLAAKKVDDIFHPLEGMTVIEHLKPQSLYPDLVLDYNNLVLCCQGQAGRGVLHCDASKSNTETTISPLENRCMMTINYRFKEGAVKSSDATYCSELKNILKLNNELLMQKRKVLNDKLISKCWESKKTTLGDLEKLRERWSQRDKGRYRAYCGVAIALLDKWIRKMRKCRETNR